ncbi:MAG: FtsX-like permease family protein, partial [Terriglobales bacterium]
PGLGIALTSTMHAWIDDSGTAYLDRSAAWMVGGFALLALLLGVVGVYGVIAYSARQRTHEIGIRMALGAPRASVYRLILQQAAWLAGAGIAIGLVISLGAAQALRSLLFATAAADPAILAGVAVVLALAAFLACYFPARRAARVDPTTALRQD